MFLKNFKNKLNVTKFQLKCFLVIITCLMSLTWTTEAQCPWNRQSVELNSDCICDFNPSSLSSSFEDNGDTNVNGNGSNNNNNNNNKHHINRMSVQCSSASFNQLLKALKQSASVELPKELITDKLEGLANSSDINIQDAGAQLASQAKLDLLQVSHSSIRSLQNYTFILDTTSFPYLASINRTTNSDQQSLKNLLPNSQSHLIVALQSLHLSRSGIQSIEPAAFSGLEWSLTSLSLCDNELESIPSDSLRRLINLKVLDLSNNKILRLPANSFMTNGKLQTLRLSDNRLLSGNPHSDDPIDPLAFFGLERSLQDLSMKNSQLNIFPSAISQLNKLIFLNLAQNYITQIPPESFISMRYLTAINLERNRLTTLDNRTFSGVEQTLSSLSLLGNLLSSYPTEQLSRLTSLGRLDIGFNEIEIIPVNAFASNKRLILIALDGNPLESLPEQAFKHLENQLQGLSVGGRALNCDCRLSWMLRWQYEHKLHISSRERDPQFCAKPNYLRSLVSFVALKPDHLSCSSNQTVQTVYLPSTVTQFGWVVNKNRSQQGDDPISTSTIATPTSTTGAPIASTTMSSNLRFELQTKALEVTPSMMGSTTTIPPTTTRANVEFPRTTQSSTTSVRPTEISSSDEVFSERSDDYDSTPSPEDLFASTTTQRSRQVIGDQPEEKETTQLISKKWKTHPIFTSREDMGTNGIFPDYESFIAATFDGPRTMTNRQGVLPIVRTPSNGAINDSSDIFRLNASSIAHNSTPSQTNRSRFFPNSKRNILRTNSQTIAEIHQQTSNHGNSLNFHSLFGSFGARANDTNGHQLRNNSRVYVANPQSSSSNLSLVPAIPTTINVYKATNQYYNSNQSSHQSDQGSNSVRNQTRNRPYNSSNPMKGFRLVDHDSSSQSLGYPAQSTRLIPTTELSENISGKPTVTSVHLNNFEVDNIDRYTTSSSSVQAQFQNPNLSFTKISSGNQVVDPIGNQTSTELRNILTESPMLDLTRNGKRIAKPEVTKSPTRPTTTRHEPATTTTISTLDFPTEFSSRTSTPNNSRMSVLSMSKQLSNNDDITSRLQPPTTMRISTSQEVTTTISLPNPKTQSSPKAVTTPMSIQDEPETRMAATVRVVESQGPLIIGTTGNVIKDLSSGTTKSPAAPTTTTSEFLVAQSIDPPRTETTRPEVRTIRAKPLDSLIPTIRQTNIQKIAKPTASEITTQRPILPVTEPATRQSVERPTLGTVEQTSTFSLNQARNFKHSSEKSVIIESPQRIPQTSPSPAEPVQTSQVDLVNTSSKTIERSDQTIPTRPRQSKDDSSQESIISQIFSTSRQSNRFGQFIRLADFDQFALVLAGLLCISILMFAITVVCICMYTSSSDTLRCSDDRMLKSSIEKSLSKNRLTKQKSSSCYWPLSWLLHLLRRLTCCLGSSRGSDRRVTAMRSLILQDDDNSSGSSGGQAQIDIVSNRKLDSVLLRHTNPVDLPRSRSFLSTSHLKPQKRSNTLNRINSTFLFPETTNMTNSMRDRNSDGQQRRENESEQWVDPEHLDTLSVSCYSEKSCQYSNRNNLNLTQHSGLLQTVDMTTIDRNCDFNINDMTEQNRADPKVQTGYKRRQNTSARHCSGQATFKGRGQASARTQGSSQDREFVEPDTRRIGVRNARFVGNDICLIGDELVPMSAEDDCQWPEPYVEPIEEMEMHGRVGSKHYSSMREQHYQANEVSKMQSLSREDAELSKPGHHHNHRHHNHNHHHHHHHHHRLSQSDHNSKGLKNDITRKNDERDKVYFANWFSMSQMNRANKIISFEANRNLDTSRHDSGCIMEKCKSIPSLNSRDVNQEHEHSEEAQTNGGSSWLRWSHKNLESRNEDSNGENLIDYERPPTRDWKHEKQIESIYMTRDEKQHIMP